jgi:outer membrane protein
MMLRGFLARVLMLAVLAFPGAALAETSIAVVDLQKVMTESTAARNILDQVQAYREKSQAEIGAVEEKLRNEQKVLAEGQNTMPAEEFKSKKESFEQSLGQTRNLVQEKKQTLDEAFSKSMGMLRDEVLKIVAGISEEKGYQIVLTRQNVVLVEKPFDITEEVMTRINASMTKASLDLASE